MYLISDNIDTLTGMRLAGIEGSVVHKREELKEILEHVMNQKEIGIVLLTEKFGRDYTYFSMIFHACSPLSRWIHALLSPRILVPFRLYL